jgi:hypothetical protein
MDRHLENATHFGLSSLRSQLRVLVHEIFYKKEADLLIYQLELCRLNMSKFLRFEGDP